MYKRQLLVGGLVGRWALAEVPRLAPTQTKLAAVLAAVVVAALGVVLLDALGGGSIGAVRLSDIGAPGLPLLLGLLVELALGALAVAARDWWQLRR